jgi:hypothetical protein
MVKILKNLAAAIVQRISPRRPSGTASYPMIALKEVAIQARGVLGSINEKDKKTARAARETHPLS